MAKNNHTETKDPEKTLDVPPYGSRNPDPITDTPGSHPVETGIGAALGGAASGAAVGLVGGPVGAAIGAAVGAIAGGYAGKGVGELIDPTTQDNWLRESFDEKKYVKKGDTYEKYVPAYQYAGSAAAKYGTRPFSEAETDLRTEWEKTHAKTTGMTWDRARDAVRDAYDRTLTLHEERLNVTKDRVGTGEVDVRKEVHTEHKKMTVPVEKEEVVITRKAVGGKAVAGDIKAEEIRIPVSEERVNVSKETVVKEEVTVGKRKVTEQETVEGDVRHEEVKVEEKGKAKAKGK